MPQLGERVAVVGHSMGGGAAVLYAGTEPERVSALVSIEGLGMPDSDPAETPARVAGWLEDLRRVGRRPSAGVVLEHVVERMRARFPHLPLEAARHLVRHNTREEGGERRWKFDPLHQTRAPQPSYVAQTRAFWRRVACPVLYVEGGESVPRLGEADLEERLEALRARRVSIAGAAHHPHLEQPAALASVLIDFLGTEATEPRESRRSRRHGI